MTYHGYDILALRALLSRGKVVAVRKHAQRLWSNQCRLQLFRLEIKSVLEKSQIYSSHRYTRTFESLVFLPNSTPTGFRGKRRCAEVPSLGQNFFPLREEQARLSSTQKDNQLVVFVSVRPSYPAIQTCMRETPATLDWPRSRNLRSCGHCTQTSFQLLFLWTRIGMSY